MAACIAHIHTCVTSDMILCLIHFICRRTSKIHDEIISNYVSVWRFGLVSHSGCYNISFCASILNTCSVDVLSPVTLLIVKGHISMMRSFCRIYSCVGTANHHVVNLKVISKSSADRHRLIQGIDELLP